LWDVPYAKNSIDYTRIIQEFLLLGSKFNLKGAYTTPDSIWIIRPMRERVIEFKREYATEGQEQRERMSHLSKPKVYIELRALIIPESYSEELRYERKRLVTLQDRPLILHVQAGTRAVLQRDSRMTSGYTVTSVTNSQNLGPRERPGLHQTDPRR
jgi:hypothetical protein